MVKTLIRTKGGSSLGLHFSGSKTIRLKNGTALGEMPLVGGRGLGHRNGFSPGSREHYLIKFLNQRVKWRSGGRIKASDLYVAYCDACRAIDHRDWHFSKSAFGLFLNGVEWGNGQKLTSLKSSCTFYQNIAFVNDPDKIDQIMRAEVERVLSEAKFSWLVEAYKRDPEKLKDLVFAIFDIQLDEESGADNSPN